MHPDEVPIDAPLVRSLIDTQFPDWASLPIDPVHPRGTDNALFRLGDRMVVRMPRRERNVQTLLKERSWLAALAPSLPAAVPLPVAAGDPTADYPLAWSIYTWLDGEAATPERLPDSARTAVQLADFISALRGIDPTGGPPPGNHNFFRGADLATRDALTRNAIRNLGKVIDGRAATTIWRTALRADPWRDAPVWIHGDLDARNLLAHDGEITAVIDWGCLGVGDPACDVMVAWKMLPPGARQSFRDRLAVDADTWARARGWVVSQAVLALAYYTDETNPPLVAEGRRWLGEAIAGY